MSASLDLIHINIVNHRHTHYNHRHRHTHYNHRHTHYNHRHTLSVEILAQVF